MTDCAAKASRLFVFDRATNLKFLIDTGSEISVIPSARHPRLSQSGAIQLYAANNSKIAAYGTANYNLNLGLRRKFPWTFVIADVSLPIIGADFLTHFHLIVDLQKKRVIDSTTSLQVYGKLESTSQASVTTISGESPYAHILSEFTDITNPCLKRPTPAHDTVHFIQTRGPPVVSKPRRLHPSVHETVKKEFEFLLDQGIIRPSKSNWSSPLHIVSKKDSSIRPVGDYRKLNSVTVFDSYPVPYLQDFSCSLYGKKIFSKLDIFKAYHHIPINEDDIPKTAITTPWGLYEFTHLSFGLVNAAQTFMRFMHEVLRGMSFCFVYLDDILCFSANRQEHEQHLRQIFERLHGYGLKLNMKKCVLGVPEIEFLGHIVNSEGTKPLPNKVQVILDYKQPETISDLRKFLGLLNFYRRFLPHAAEHQALLSVFLKGSQKKRDKKKIAWTPATTSAFSHCKEHLAKATLLAHPSASAKLSLSVDASDYAIGGALHQLTDDGHLQPLAFFSRKLSLAESRYSAYDRELLAAYCSIKHFRHMLEAREFILYTDHKPLCFAFRQKGEKCSPRQIRQLDYISQFTANIQHVSGSNNIAADLMSRISAINFPTVLDFPAIAAAQVTDTELAALLQNPRSLDLKHVTLPNSDVQIYCDFSTGKARPYIPHQFRRQVFDNLHNLAHPGVKRTTNLVRHRFIWPSLNKDIATWAKHCVSCQASKVSRHTKSSLKPFSEPSQRFQQVHIDIIGPLPSSEGFRYCLTCIDRFSRWPEVQPLMDITASTVAAAFYSCWVSRYGTPAIITTDRGGQFEACLFKSLSTLLGSERSRTTSFHPQSNGLIEELHRPLKAAIMCHGKQRWTEILPTVLLGLRSALKEDLRCTPAELVFGATLRLPGEFFDSSHTTGDPTHYVEKLRNHMRQLRPRPPSSHGKRPTYIPRELHSASHVFVRRDTVRRSLQRPYDGPFLVLDRNDKVFKLSINGKSATVSIDRLKPAFIITPDSPPVPTPVVNRTPIDSSESDYPTTETSPTGVTTRSGRRVRFPDFYRVSAVTLEGESAASLRTSNQCAHARVLVEETKNTLR